MSVKNKEIVFVSGKISGDMNYKEKFDEARKNLEQHGFIVLNPAVLPSEGLSYQAYMRISIAMLDESDSVCFLPDALYSNGSMKELDRATEKNKRIFTYEGWKNEIKNNRRNNNFKGIRRTKATV